MSLGVTVLFAWVVATGAASYALVKRIDSLKPGADWGGIRQLIWHALPAVITLAATYVMLTGAAEGRMVIPSKMSTQYFYAESQPVAFWLLLIVEFLITSALSAVLVATSFLVLRSSRDRA